MRLLAFSDLHTDVERARKLAEQSARADVVIGVGDFASVHRGLEETIAELGAIDRPTVLVPGNNETEEALRSACADWASARVLHGSSTQLDGIEFFGLGAGVPVTPWDWSFDLTEDEAQRMLEGCPPDCVLAVHSPPRGHVDRGGGGEHLGSVAVLRAIEKVQPRLALCGHIHESWGKRSRIGRTEVLNLGPEGAWLDA